MKELGFNVVIEEGDTGQFELFKSHQGGGHSNWTWVSYMKEGPGIPKFFTLADVEKKLAGSQ